MDYNKSADFYTGVSKVLAEKPDVMFIGGASSQRIGGQAGP